MTANIGTLITAPIRPNDDGDLIASAFSSEIRGGHHSYATVSERDAIIEARRQWGMLVTVYNDSPNNGLYQLTYNHVNTTITDDSNWVLLMGGSTWLNSAISVLSTPPTSPSVGDRYLIATTASGDWTSSENKPVEWIASGTWSYITPVQNDAIIADNALYLYSGTYPTGTWSAQLFGGLAYKYYITNETITVPQYYQYFIYGDLTIDTGGALNNYGEVVIMNGQLICINGGTFSNYSATPMPITVNTDVSKYSYSGGLTGSQLLNVEHNLNSSAFIINVYDTVLGSVSFTYSVVDDNTIEVTPGATVSNGRIVIVA